jgi:hypothetical protein
VTREHWVSKLNAIVARLEAGDAPARVREVYVFGSFSRGALDPHDLDLIVVHDPPTAEALAPFSDAVKGYSYDKLDQAAMAGRRFDAAMRKVFRRGSEHIDVLTGTSLREVLGGIKTLPREEVKLVWSEQDRDWGSRLAAIRPVAGAGRYPRNHFIEVRRTAGSVDDVESVTELIGGGALTLRPLELDGIEPRLNPAFRGWLDYWTRVRAFGAEALKVLPWAMWWLQEQDAPRPFIWDRTELGDEDRRFHVQLVRLYPAYVPALFAREPLMVRHCLLPRWRVREANLLYVFERGANWPGSYPTPREA